MSWWPLCARPWRSALAWRQRKRPPPSWFYQVKKGGRKGNRGISQMAADAKEGAEKSGKARRGSLSATDRRAFRSSLSSGSLRLWCWKRSAATSITKYLSNAYWCQAIFLGTENPATTLSNKQKEVGDNQISKMINAMERLKEILGRHRSA